MSDRYFQHTFPNGLTLLVEKMPGVQSGAMTFLLDAGASTDPVDRTGSATVLSDLVLRGAGDRDSRTLTAYLDSLGLQRSSSVGIHHTRLRLAPRWPSACSRRCRPTPTSSAARTCPPTGSKPPATWHCSPSKASRTSRARS